MINAAPARASTALPAILSDAIRGLVVEPISGQRGNSS